MPRRVRLKLLGEGWRSYPEPIPEDRVIEISEAEAAAFLRLRGMHRHVEFLGWVDDQDERADPAEISN